MSWTMRLPFRIFMKAIAEQSLFHKPSKLDSYVAQFIEPENHIRFRPIRIVLLGATGSGKSTLVQCHS